MRRLRMRGDGRGEGPLELAADRRGREENDRRRRQGVERGSPGSRRPGRRALLPLEGLDARALDAGARLESGAAAAGRKEARQDRHRRRARRAVAHQVALSSWSQTKSPPRRTFFGRGPTLIYFSAASTARLHITVMRCARYSGEACRSLFRPSGFTLMLATASGANFAASAFSISVLP